MSRPIQARIDATALAQNLRVIRKRSASRILAVIKADAYGHGVLRAAEALEEADGFGLLNIRDALRVREAGHRQPILLLEGCFDANDMALAAEHGLSCVVHSDWQLGLLDAYPKRAALEVWLKINTGMNRLGFNPQDVPAVIARLRGHAAVGNVVLMTHFANADEGSIDAPLNLFRDIAAQFRLPRSLANSAALLRYPQIHGEWVRPGLALYGASPFAETSAAALGLKPVMTLSSRVIAVRELRAGDEVGYGATFRAERSMRVGIVACGYADGYPRHAGTGTPVLVAGQRTRSLGRVSMDMLCVDLSALSGAGVGSEVVLWGEGLPVEEIALSAGTISYELMCGLTARVPVVG
ncbi:MAG: alanine racemase [Gallionella sp.]|nr:alanine racemase [Gallionella sp.]